VTAGRIVELAVAVAFLVAGVLLYRRRDRNDAYGSQGAVLLFVVAAILAIHALRLLEYRPSASETEMMRQASE
jgi:hypothetical protein